jgi:hypothetical protein
MAVMIEKFSEAEIRHSNAVGLPKLMNKMNEMIEAINATLSDEIQKKQLAEKWEKEDRYR